MRDIFIVLITLCFMLLKLNSGASATYHSRRRIQPIERYIHQRRLIVPIRRSNNKESRVWNSNGNSPLMLDQKKKLDLHQKSYEDQNYRRKHSRVKFRSNHEEKNNEFPKLKQSTEKKTLIRSTRLVPEPEKLSLRQGSPRTPDDVEAIDSPLLRLNPFTIKDVMTNIMKKMPRTNTTVKVIAKTVEYNEIVLCKIRRAGNVSSKYFRAKENIYANDEPERKIVLIVHGLSAMGFNQIPCLSNEVYLKKLIDIYVKHLDKFDIYLVPMANPDAVGDSTLAFWNKNKSPQAHCLGVALDRNFDVAWNNNNKLSSCSQQYPGPDAFSEPESRAIADLMHLLSHRLVGYIHVHAGTYYSNIFKGDAVLYPKGYSETNSDDDKYIDLKGDIEDAMKTAGFRSMSVTVEPLNNWYGIVPGTSVDYASSIYGIPYAMEFVMQIYEDSPLAANSEERITNNVLTEIWDRIIGVVFENIHKNTQPNDA